MNKSNSPIAARTVAQLARRLGLSQEIIAQAVGASQSQVSRVLAGKSGRRSRLFDAICNYVQRHANKSGASNSITESPELIEAVESVWDGTHAHALALATVIRSLGTLQSDRRRKSFDKKER